MDFTEDLPIYLQIVEWMGNKMLSGDWQEGGRIPSVREAGGLLQVNPNTVMRAYERMQAVGAIENKRGIGYFVAPGARSALLEVRRGRFLNEELPQFFARADRLSIGIDEIARRYETFKNERS
jgi:DNA-binding transcriptional regulator YhcF (GntR family)